MSNIQRFSFQNLPVRTVENEGTTWFVLKDVCDVLDIQNPTQAVNQLDDDERAMFYIGRQGEANIINESGLYALILRSNKPNAKPFRKWVTSEVLPTIRKTGSYGLVKADYDKLLTESYDHLKTILMQNAEIVALKSKPKWSPLSFLEKQQIQELKSGGLSWAAIARKLDRSVSAVKSAGRVS